MFSLLGLTKNFAPLFSLPTGAKASHLPFRLFS